MKTIKLMADYHSYPLWWSGSNRFGNIDPKDLPISEELVDDLLLWAAFYNQTLNEREPGQSGFNSAELEGLFTDYGHKLWVRLKSELDEEYVVEYFYRGNNE